MVCVCVFWLCCVVAVVIVVDCAGGCVAFPRSHLTGVLMGNWCDFTHHSDFN